MNALARLFSALLRWGLGLCAAILVLAALYVSLGRELVPLVAEYRLELEDRATAQLGVPVRIGRLEGHWQGFAPVLVAHDVHLGDEEQGLSLERVQLVPDVGASLLARQPQAPERIFNHAQSEYLLGYIAYLTKRADGQRNLDQVKLHWGRYLALADRLVSADPANPRWQRELGYAQSNLCAANLTAPASPQIAQPHCAAARQIAERLADLLELRADERTLFLQVARGLASGNKTGIAGQEDQPQVGRGRRRRLQLVREHDGAAAVRRTPRR